MNQGHAHTKKFPAPALEQRMNRAPRQFWLCSRMGPQPQLEAAVLFPPDAAEPDKESSAACAGSNFGLLDFDAAFSAVEPMEDRT